MPGPSTTGDQSGIYTRTLDAIVDRLSVVHPIIKQELTIGDWVVVTTKNSVYSLQVLSGEHYAVSGGWFDKEGLSPCQVQVNGCTWGGNAIKEDILAAPGLFMEFGNQVKTTRIQHVRVIRGQGPDTVN